MTLSAYEALSVENLLRSGSGPPGGERLDETETAASRA
jgi:hypothetical protein